MNDCHPHSEPENRRAHIRLQNTVTERMRVRLVSLEGCSVNVKPGLIYLSNIGPGGCGFHSALRFPVTPRLVLELEGEMEGERLAYLGQLRWGMPDENGYRYGMRFLLSFEERLRLKYILNRLVLKTCPGQAKIHSLYRSHVSSI